MSWLRRSIGSDSTWFKLHYHEMFSDAFHPIRANFDSVSRAKTKCKNLWKEIYSSLIECRINVLLDHPYEYRHVPINGEPLITSNRIPIRQEWAQYRSLNAIIDSKGNFRELVVVDCNRKPFEYEYCE